MSAPASGVAPTAAASPSHGNPLRALKVIKVVVNAGVGESGEARTKAEKVLQMVTHQKPVATRAHSTNRDFGIREGQEIGAKTTLRGPGAVEFLEHAFEARDRQLDPNSIDRFGNFSFGIADYTDFTGMKYDPQIGIHGMDIAVEIGRSGWRVRDRRTRSAPIPRRLRSTREETRRFLEERFKVTFVE
ncbi:MAG: 50S ribosomal protein L5 [Candidatus Thermoplasmatota archaeon]|jgi:large subunit ribosomal protein L5|nr:50S ribosomal protein L5 [Candidatus Thermoplasmatota archaeon]